MAGSNIVLKDGQVLFKEGQDADGMYLIRKGELKVYLEKDGNEVKLATIGPGGMIGEMAFFDQKPRSASVKAFGDTEVTKITSDDFAKLMRQIPKWFVSIMSSLSTRLRETNDRLQKVENLAAGAKSPFEDLIKILHVLVLIWHKEGFKDGKNWCLNRATAEKEIKEIFGITDEWITELFDLLVKQKFFAITTDNYKNKLLVAPNKARIAGLANFIRAFTQAHKGQTRLPNEGLEILKTLASLAKESAYDAVSIPFEDAVTEGERLGYKTSNWRPALAFFKVPNDALSLSKHADGIGFKVNEKEIEKFLQHHELLAILSDAGLK